MAFPEADNSSETDSTRLSARLFIVGIDFGDASCREILEAYPVGGVILFAHNVSGERELVRLTAEIHALPGRPFVCIDHEGGGVNRLRPIMGELPAPVDIGRMDPEAIVSLAADWGARLASLGIDLNFAPAVDLGPAEEGSGLQNRLMGEDSADVINKADAFIAGMADAGISCCLKHYPGLGGSRRDTHMGCVELKREAVQDRHREPFSSLRDRVPLMMLSHAVYPDLDRNRLPASASPTICMMARNDGFDGVLVGDDLEMEALASLGSLPDRAAAVLAAGCDMVILSHRWDQLPEAAASAATIGEDILTEKIGRVEWLQERIRSGRKDQSRRPS